MRPILATLALMPCLVPAGSGAAELALATRIDRVTVYPDAALVTRLGETDLPAGPSTLTVTNLPAGLDPNSIRVAARGSAALVLGAVDVRPAPAETKPDADPAAAALARVRETRDGLAVRLATLEAKKSSIERYALVGPDKAGPEGRILEPAQWPAAWDAVEKSLSAVNGEIRELRTRLEPVEAEIRAAEAVRPAVRAGEPRRDVVIALEAPAALKGEIEVSYRVRDAAWTPSYDARLETGGPGGTASLGFVRRAGVTQRTGEDWTDVSLSVSTAQVAGAAGAPDLQPLRASFYEPPSVSSASTQANDWYRYYAMQQARGLQSYQAQQSNQQNMAVPAPPPSPAPIPAIQQEAAREASTYSATFRIPGRVGIARDGLVKTFVLGTSRPSVQLAVATTPELDDTAYLSAAFTVPDDTPLLAGEASLHRDGAYVGRARVKATPPGETVTLGFGTDERVKVARVPVRRRENDPTNANQAKTDLRAFRTTVRNLHAEPMRVTVTDRLPYSDNTAITVEQLRETTPPTEQAPDDRRGVMVWSYVLAPGETREIRLAYRLRFPSDREIVLETKPVKAGPRS